MNFTLDARTASPHFPGIGRYVRSLAEEIPSLLLPDETITLLHAGITPPEWTLQLLPKVRTAAAPYSPFGPAQQWKVPPLLKGTDVYHSAYYLMPYRPGAPTVLTIYDMIPILFPDTVSLRARLLFRLTTHLALAAADQIICISEATRRDLLGRFSRLNRVHVHAVPLAPAPQFFPQAEQEQERVRKKYDLPFQFALYVGTNKPHKNLHRLVLAWEQVETGMPLVIAGGWDPRYPEPRETATHLGMVAAGRVRFIGRIPEADLPALYSACTLFVFPSLYEGFGLPVVEALACGAQVVCSGISSLPEVGGDAAMYFDPTSVENIAAAIDEAAARPAGPEPATARAGEFSWHRTAAATVEIYRSIAYNSTA